MTGQHAMLPRGERSRLWATYSADCLWVLGLPAYILATCSSSRPAAYSSGWDSLLY